VSHRPGAAGLMVLMAAVATGCATPLANLRARQDLSTGAGRFAVLFAEHDVGSDKIVERALREVSPQLTRWGGLKEPVRVHVLPNHEQLEEAVDKKGFRWLRAWARYDEIYVQSPRTWSFFGATQQEVNETLLHELTHSVMYQQAGTLTTWRRKEIPIWFREGMASFSANQGYRWPTLEDLALYYQGHPGGADPVSAASELYQSESDIVYGAAHHAFGFLVRRYGEDAVRRILAGMSRGQVFPEAFTEAVGISPKAFTTDFQNYVRFRAFRGGRLRRPFILDPRSDPKLAPGEKVAPDPKVAPDAAPPAPATGGES